MVPFLICLVAFVLDTLVRIFFQFGSWSPDLLLISILYVGLTRPLGEAYGIAFLFGLLWDVAYLDITGLHAFLFVVSTLIIGKLRRVFWAQYSISRLFMGFMLCSLVRFGEIMFWLSNQEGQVSIWVPKEYILNGAIVTALCFFFFFPMRVKPMHISQRTPRTIFAEK